MSSPVRIYTSESEARQWSTVVREVVRGFRDSTYVAYRLARKDIKDTYSASALGMVWDILDPLILAAIFYYLMKARLISSANLGMPASVFVVYGMLLYATYTECLLLSVDLMKRSGNLLTHLRIPPEGLIVSVAYRSAFYSVFRILVMLFFSIFAGVFSPLGFMKFLALFPLIIFWGMAPGILLAPFNVIYNDVGRLVRLTILPLRFLAPVIYAIPPGTLLDKLQVVNPVTMVLDNLRSLAVNNQFVDLGATAIHLGVLLILGALGCLVFHVAVPILAERT